MFIIEDEIHAEKQGGEFETFEEALELLKELAEIPWNEKPNQCPCTNWKTCERQYQIIEYDDTTTPWKEVNAKNVLIISAKEIKWLEK